ncbi:hypothetical protein ACWDWO_25835 [Actinopolymorpha singaporensis]
MTKLQVTIQAKKDVSVVIENVRVRNRRTLIPKGVSVWCPAGGAELRARRFSVDLDEFRSPTVYFVGANDEIEAPPALTLAAGEIERFHVWVRASSGWNEWVLELPLLVEGRRVSVPIKDGRKRFVTVGDDHGGRELFRQDERWIPRDQLFHGDSTDP